MNNSPKLLQYARLSLIAIFTLFIWQVFVSCHQNPSDTSTDATFTADEFPVSVGSWWRYQTTDALATPNTIDTVLLQVNSKEPIANGFEYHCVTILKGSVVDSSVFKVYADSLLYQGLTPTSSNYDLILRFPFTVGKTWNAFSGFDNVEVLSQADSKIILTKEYKKVFECRRANSKGAGNSLTNSFTLCPKVGLIEQSVDVFIGSPTFMQKSELIDYHIAQ